LDGLKEKTLSDWLARNGKRRQTIRQAVVNLQSRQDVSELWIKTKKGSMELIYKTDA
jgi:hypothetical protein